MTYKSTARVTRKPNINEIMVESAVNHQIRTGTRRQEDAKYF
jgi:hypothetical protein